MLQVKDIQIGEIYYIVKISKNGDHYDIDKIKPTKVFIDEERLGNKVILIESEFNPCFRYWQPRENNVNEYVEFRTDYPYIFDNLDNVQNFLNRYENS